MEPTIPPQPIPTQPITPTAPAPVKPKSNSLSVFIVIILFLALCVVGFLVYQNYQLRQQISQVQPTPTPFASPELTEQAGDPTANWKTYTDTKYFYSFKYPSEYVLGQHLAGNGMTLSNQQLSGQGLVIDLNPTDTKIDLETLTTQRRNDMFNLGTQSSIDTTTISGLTAKHFSGSGEKYGDTYIMKPNPNYALEIEVLYPSKDAISQYKQLATQILSTFIFTK